MNNILVGKVYIHKPSGVRYKVIGFVLHATGYETNKKLQEMVYYTQLEDGKLYKVGQSYVRLPKDFVENFKPLK